MLRRMMLGVLAIVVAALAAAAVAPSASADGTLDHSYFVWSHRTLDEAGQGPAVAVKFAAGGGTPNSASLPTAIYFPVYGSSITYKIVGTGVTLSTETLTKTVNGSSVSYSSSYYDLGNGITYNKSASGQLESSSTTAEASEKSYKWRAVSYHGFHSEIDLTVAVTAVTTALDISQPTTDFTLTIMSNDTHGFYTATGGTSPYTYSFHEGHVAPLSDAEVAASCARHTITEARAKCIADAQKTMSDAATAFASNAPITYNASAQTLQLVEKMHSVFTGYQAEASDLGEYDFTVMATDSAGAKATQSMTVTVEPHPLIYLKTGVYLNNFYAGSLNPWSSITRKIPPGYGGVKPITFSVANPPDGFSMTSTHWTYASPTSWTGSKVDFVTITITATDSQSPATSADFLVYLTIFDSGYWSQPGVGLLPSHPK